MTKRKTPPRKYIKVRRTLAKKVAKISRQVRASAPELKTFVTEGSTANVYSSAPQLLNLLGAITQGDGWTNRDGKEIRVMSIKWVLRFVNTGAFQYDHLFTRHMLVCPKQQTFNTAPTAAELLVTVGNWASGPNPDYVPDKYSVIKDQRKIYQEQFDGAATMGYLTGSKSWKGGKRVVFSANTDDIMKNGLYSMFIGNQETNPLTVNYQYIVKFYE